MRSPLRLIRFLLFPFSIIYGIVVFMRNTLFDLSILPSIQPKIITILVGNLSTGGTGKTPFIEYLIENLHKKHGIVVLSRGYGRKSKGFIWVENHSDSQVTGDEPLQIKKQFPSIGVAVCEDRREGISRIQSETQGTDLILMDDGFQHRQIKGHIQILLSKFSQPFFRDFLLPVGDLREWRCGSRRADMLVFTKCPEQIDESEMKQYATHSKKTVFFGTIGYANLVDLDGNDSGEWQKFSHALAVSGLANSGEFEEAVGKRFDKMTTCRFRDHKIYRTTDIEFIIKKFRDLPDQESCCLVTTKKDAVKLKNTSLSSQVPVFILPFQHKMIDESGFMSTLNARITAESRG